MDYDESIVKVAQDDCRELMKALPDNSIDSIVTDPPYELAFMGKKWDSSGIAFDAEVWAQAYRVLKPGGHLLAFGGTRTFHRLAVAIEDAGFEIRDSIAWLYGTGFPKSLNVSKAIDKLDTAPATDDAKKWEGWGTAMKPAFEPIIVARKPLVGTVAANVLAHGTGVLNIDGCRVEGGERPQMVRTATVVAASSMAGASTGATASGETTTLGRWPANVILDESQAAILDEKSGERKAGGTVKGTEDSRTGQNGIYGTFGRVANKPYNDTGGASRFFYCAKSPKSERPKVGGVAHPTVKPLTLIRYLVKLVTPLGGTVLDPFAGSGTTGEAALIEGFRAILMENEEKYIPLIEERLKRCY